MFGDITSSTAQAIVSSDDNYITMGGGVSGAILRTGGQEIMIDAAKKVPAKLGDVVVTNAGRLNAQYIFHAITIEHYPDEAEPAKIVRQCVSRCFDLLDALALQSIAFPAIGAGAAGFSYGDVAVEMASVIAERLARSDRPIDVTLYLFDQFGMQPMDFIQFFEEFARRMPQLRPSEASTADVVESADGTATEPTGPVARQQQARLRLNALTQERAELEERMADSRGSAEDSRDLRTRLDTITDRRIELLKLLQEAKSGPVSLFISYSHKDQEFREELEKHLSILQRHGVIATWHDRQITAGTEWRGAIDDNLRSARLILLLVSPDFIASDYCYDVEVRCAMDRHDAGEARVVPVILRRVMWDQAPFAKLQALPTDGKPVKAWEDRDAAFENVARGIRAVVESIATQTKVQSA
jgi:O-acetyl-ADP-ribose deacetylase (regulator of RNase III)